jgi:G3E family GTPase
MSAPTPLVIVTGFLGAGKTTLLNRVLGVQHHRRLAVIVNELGRIDVDARLLKARAGDVVELAGGCVCHEVRTMDELWQAFDEVRARSRPDVILLETTGIAEPEPLLEGLAARADSASGRQTVVTCRVVTVVDAEAGAALLDRHPEARAQVTTADRLLLSKLDLATPTQLGALHGLLEQLNPGVERASFPPGPAGSAALVPWLLDDLHPRADRVERRRLRRRSSFAGGAEPSQGSAVVDGDDHAHPHAHGQLAVVALSEEAPLLPEPLLALCGRLGSALVRAKGFVQLAGEPRQAFLERAGLRLDLRLGDPWPPGPRRSEIVLIGDGLDAASLQRQLWACRAPLPEAHG